ncbi:MAG: hypothetical protein A2806_03560 [Candidatus Terrybacteria bacterium RIFCSPHIGHO2_01_FULL_48_17]|uniref:Aspartyl/glutamyl-tRNA(Asn/Gln) amidotransferase subunit C n=1 Tax=Candidatus Terrybacteria bacterium RIFCSPHIGHO2_01_FULL_48_17 TaxID=1802362 RepID=A0A1G2PH38_9BACT|nr:MAG: hypothetical protein A2806_03560 [Candidatus Terrybacteria bacterium RIFCSPHIGHO2_01_FULL_48_17]OHA53100.1 MAG: hypothetical protein A3A30_01900 [Candidatus Terrybacteria bacterium RIFCSPLOWO2_01_FULL_48_14]
MIDDKTVRHIAHLAHVGLNDNDIGKFSKELSAILEYIKELDRYDTTEVDAIAHATGLENQARKDISKDAALANIKKELLEEQAPKTQNDFVVVPRVIE